jgi:hypothetical protein
MIYQLDSKEDISKVTDGLLWKKLVSLCFPLKSFFQDNIFERGQDLLKWSDGLSSSVKRLYI